MGSYYALCNSIDLYNDAMLLFKDSRHSRAYALFQLSTEEAGKVILLIDSHVRCQFYKNTKEVKNEANLNQQYKILNDVFFDHSEKMKYIMHYERLRWNRFYRAFNPNHVDVPLVINQNDIARLNKKKNDSLYTSVEDDKFIAPFHRFNHTDVLSIRDRAFQKITHARQGFLRFVEGSSVPKEINIKGLKEVQLDLTQ